MLGLDNVAGIDLDLENWQKPMCAQQLALVKCHEEIAKAFEGTGKIILHAP